ncbi:MAG TPA: SGNH/GDSL hydrolase family protein [Longimicrobium sp.]|nr:SGNH/GDSL hydrolase family protein [Longimicrobium sp.]
MTIGIWRGGRSIAAAVIAMVVLGMGCGSATAPQSCGTADGGNGGKRILFIGNSLTYFNGLPQMFAALADSAGQTPPRVEEVAYPDFGLQQHWEDGRAADAIRAGCWDVVVLQQGPSSLADSRANLLDYVGRYAQLIRERGGQTALFSVWPAAARQGDFDRAIESYALAAQAVDGVLLPAATAWLQAWAREPDLALYADGLHPTPQGSYLAAAVMVGRLYGQPQVRVPARLEYRLESGTRQEVRLDAAAAGVLQEAARAALAMHPHD